MQASKKTNRNIRCGFLPLVALMLVIGAMFFTGTTAYAADEPPAQDDSVLTVDSLSVDEVWLTGDTLHISVTDKSSGESQTLELNLKDYAKSSDEYVSVQATDKSGNTSNTIQFKNPYYVPQKDIAPGEGETAATTDTMPSEDTSESSVPSGAKPFTPDGAGSVVDNATDGDGKEFFTVETTDDNTFYLIVDRQRTSENVYLLNAVNENDLASLAKPGDGKSESGIPATATPPTVTPAPEVTPEPTTAPPPAPEKSSSTSTIVLVVIAIVVVGGAGYYIKIVRPKKNATDGGDSYDEESDEDAEEEYDSENTDGEGETDD